MGFNKIAFIRNDCVQDILNAPKTIVSLLTDYNHKLNYNDYRQIYDLAKHHNELPPDPQAITVFPAIHASSVTAYVMAGNTCTETHAPKVITRKGIKYYLVPVDSSGLQAK